MTIHKDESTDVDPVQIWSAKDLEAEFTKMLKAYHDKETEFNWEARDQSITRLRGILRGNATESPYLEVLMPCMKQMVDGIVKAVESLRTQLAVKALLLVTDIGIYIGRHLDNYTTDQILLCMMRCSSLTKKMVASASLETTKSFLKHTQFYPKITNMLQLSMNEKNSQVRLYAMIYTKTLLQTHAHHDRTRQTMDRSHSTEQCETILVKGLNDPIPAVKEVCREAFWIFWEHWRDRGEGILRQLPPAAQKQLEKSKIKANTHSPTISPRASSSLGRHHVSPSTSSASNGSLKRSMSPSNNRAVSPPHLRSPPPPSSISSQMQQDHHVPTTHKTRVPTLNRKKSAVSLIKRKPTSNFMNLITSDDVFQRGEGIVLLAKKLAPFPPSFDVNNNNNNNEIQLDVPNSPPVQADQLRTLVIKLWEDHHCPELYSWDAVTCILFRLLTFEEYIPKLILEANADGKSEHDLVKQQLAQMGLVRAKLFLQSQHPTLVDTLFNSLIQYGNFTNTPSSFDRVAIGSKKDITRLPANRRKLTRQFLEWMDELVTPLIGLSEDVDVTAKAFEGVPAEYVDLVSNRDSHAAVSSTSEWFESDDNIRQCLAILLPLITTSTSGTMWHAPLVTFIKHIRLLNQRLFEMVTTTYDEYSVNKICRVLGIHIRIEPPLSIVPQQQLTEETIIQPEEPLAEEDMMIQPKEPLTEEAMVIQPEEPLFEAPPLAAPLMESTEPPVAVDEVLYDDPPLHTSSSDLTAQPLIDAPLVDKLTIQERNDILDHDAHLPTTDFDHEKKQDEIPIPDYFSPKQNVVDVVYTHDTTGSPPPNTTTTTASILDGRTVSSTSTKTTRQVVSSSPLLPPTMDAPQPLKSQSEKSLSEPLSQSVAPSPPAPTATAAAIVPAPTITQLLPSEPNLETYPLPTHVPFFAPEKVNFPNPVFRSNVRTNIVAASQSTSTSTTTANGTAANARHTKDKTTLLYTLIDKLNSPTTTTQADTFRKLTRLFKEVPIRRRWDQGGIEETGSETWAGALGDAGNFVELVQAILPHLDNNMVALECIRQLAVTQTGLFRYYERKLDDQGKSLESQLMEKLLDIRCNDNPTICVAAEDALDAVLGTLNPPTAFEMLMAFIIYRLLILPCNEELTDVRYHPVGSAFTYLGKWVKEMNETFYIDEWLSKRGGVNAIFKAINHPLINIRKSCVDAMVAFHDVLGDDMYQFLIDFREDQLNLLKYYVAKSQKKKMSLRRDNNNNNNNTTNMSNGQF